MESVLAWLLLFGLMGVGVFVAAIHFGFRAPRLPNRQTPEDWGLRYQGLALPSEQGGQLAAWFVPGRAQCKTTVVLLHGWGANKGLMMPLVPPFHALGMHVLLVDAHNHGDSAKRGVSTMPKFAQDLASAVHWLKAQSPEQAQSVVVLGHSVGAAATLLAASRGLAVDGVISLASFAHPRWMMRRQLRRVQWVPGLVGLITRYVQWVIGHRLAAIAPIETVKRIDCPVLLMHGDQDQVIPTSDHQALCLACQNQPNAHCVTVPDADHASIEKIQTHFDAIERFLITALPTHDGAVRAKRD